MSTVSTNFAQPTLLSIASQLQPVRGQISKPHAYYEIYESYFAPFRDNPIKFLEVGVFEGESTKVFSRYFPAASIIGVDVNLKDIDFSGFGNVTYRRADQASAEDLEALASQFAPEGFDIVIDDASHFGALSIQTFEHLFPRVKSGGLYVIEDWGTGYWDYWADGSAYKPPQVIARADVKRPGFGSVVIDSLRALRFRLRGVRPPPKAFVESAIPNRIASHDFGMVGFVKSLVDYAGARDIDPPPKFTDIDSIHIHQSVVIVRKR